MRDGSWIVTEKVVRTERDNLAKLYNAVISGEGTVNVSGTLDFSHNLIGPGHIEALPPRLRVERDLKMSGHTPLAREFLEVGGDLHLSGVPVGSLEDPRRAHWPRELHVQGEVWLGQTRFKAQLLRLYSSEGILKPEFDGP